MSFYGQHFIYCQLTLDLDNISTFIVLFICPEPFELCFFMYSILCAFYDYSLHVCCLGILGLVCA